MSREFKVGDQIRFAPSRGDGRRWWIVRALNDRYMVATRQAAFEPKGVLVYTVVDLVGWRYTYNGAGPGMVRSSLNTLGGGWEVGPDGEGCQDIITALEIGEFELSNRRVVDVQSIEQRPRK
ncbi:hypothetical protein SEA_APHELION_120 [Gordonia phage Aphelion]|uniref:Uncharacterized protein n=1 Tax=Gordonia phage Aphelion TaxID=2507860 RepID=A0A410TD84_9CAUD|nr:hypothetical protein SEA_APHELION_120 [Gordonia phage Aphelion]